MKKKMIALATFVTFLLISDVEADCFDPSGCCFVCSEAAECPGCIEGSQCSGCPEGQFCVCAENGYPCQCNPQPLTMEGKPFNVETMQPGTIISLKNKETGEIIWVTKEGPKIIQVK